MSQTFFTSDQHWFHENIIRFSNRPFQSLEEMNEAMIENWNAKVQKGDLVYHLGDFALKCRVEEANGILDRLHGQIILIRGNHDSMAEKVRHRFAAVKDYDEIAIPDAAASNGKRKIVLLHYAMRVWNKSHHGSWHLYGHSHGTLPDDPHSLSFDVGVDCWEYAPLSYEEVSRVMATKSFVPFEGDRE